MAVEGGAFLAEGGGELGTDFFEGGGAGFADIEDFYEIKSVTELDGACDGVFAGASEGLSDGGLDGFLGEPTDFSALGGTARFVAVGFRESGEVAGFNLLGEGIGFGFGFRLVVGGGDENLGEAVFAGQAQGVFAGFVESGDFLVAGIVAGNGGDGFEETLGDGGIAHSGEQGLSFRVFLPIGGLGFVEELFLEEDGADGAAEGGGVLEEGVALGGRDFGEVGLDLRGGDVLVPSAGDDGIGGLKRKGSEEGEDGGGEGGSVDA